MNLTPHFTLDELVRSDTADEHGIDNTPSVEIKANLVTLALGLEAVRSHLGDLPIHVSSGYRCPPLNAAVGGDPHSAHMRGWAGDFTCPTFGTPRDIVKSLAHSRVRFDKCILEGSWVHISFAPTLRGLVYTAYFGADNHPTYTAGLAEE